jgi:hypothetical protein
MRPIVLPVLAAVFVAACSAAAPAASSPAPSASPSASPSAGRSAAPASSPAITPSPSPSPSPTASPFTPPTPPPSPSTPAVGLAPSGPWSAVQWIDAGKLPLGPTEITIRGWSGGYVAFEQSPGSDENGDNLPVVIHASASSDGVHWSAPTTLKTDFAGNLAISTIVEGPSGLLALGYPYGDTCGGPPTLTAMWTSPDGRSWARLAMPKAFSGATVETIAGGGAGFIALGTKSDGTTQAIWTSPDGRAWTARRLPTVSSGTLALDGVTSFDDGFVLVGSVLGEEGCGGAAHVKAAAWFSVDGGSWTRADLPGASSDPNAGLEVSRIGGQLLATQSLPTSAPSHAWTSTDGKTWTATADVSSDLYWSMVSDGRHALMVMDPDSGTGPLILTGIDSKGVATTLTQDGGGPVETEDGPGWITAVGPTGVLVIRANGEASWLGVPS